MKVPRPSYQRIVHDHPKICPKPTRSFRRNQLEMLRRQEPRIELAEAVFLVERPVPGDIPECRERDPWVAGLPGPPADRGQES